MLRRVLVRMSEQGDICKYDFSAALDLAFALNDTEANVRAAAPAASGCEQEQT
jgi:hypothetical protein